MNNNEIGLTYWSQYTNDIHTEIKLDIYSYGKLLLKTEKLSGEKKEIYESIANRIIDYKDKLSKHKRLLVC